MAKGKSPKNKEAKKPKQDKSKAKATAGSNNASLNIGGKKMS